MGACAGAPPPGAGGTDGVQGETAEPAQGRVHHRARSPRELERAVEAVLGEDLPRLEAFVPATSYRPFDTTPGALPASSAVTLGVERYADAVATTVVGDRLGRLLPCVDDPAVARDACAMQAVDTLVAPLLGLSPARAGAALEIYREAAIAEAAGADGGAGAAQLVLHAALTDPAFLFEALHARGEASGQLDDVSILRRIYALTLGSAPRSADVEGLASTDLSLPGERAGLARELLRRPAAGETAWAFHQQWLGLFRARGGPPVLAEDAPRYAAETLSEWLLLLRRPWTGLFNDSRFNERTQERFGAIDATNDHGLLTFRAFASAGAGVDPSPTKRGKTVLERLMCVRVGPPPADAPSDTPPAGPPGTCRKDRYLAIQADPSCRGCHAQLDGVGFGLERMTLEGGVVDHEVPDGFLQALDERCPLTGHGEHPLIGTFFGPVELQHALVEQGLAQRCVARHLLGFALAVDR